MDRTIHVSVKGSYVSKDGKNAGVQGEANATVMTVTFSGEWESCAKRIIWLDARGENPTEVLLAHSPEELEAGIDPLTFETRIPGEALTSPGECSFTIEGNESGVVVLSATERLNVIPNDAYGKTAGEAEDPTPDQALQLQAQIDKANQYMTEKLIRSVNGVLPDENGNVNTPGAGTGGEVVSVNGKNGIVVLDAGDVGARPDTWTPNAKDVGAWPDTAVPENGSVVGSDEEDAQGWYDAGVLGPLKAGDDVSAVITVQHLYDNRAGILSVRVRRQTDGTYYGHCRIISGYMLDPSWYYISVDGDGVAHLIVWINARYDHAKLTVLAQEDRAAESGGNLRWDMISSGKISKPEVTITCALNTAIVDAGVAEITIETENTAARVYVGFKAGFTAAPAVVTAVTEGSPGAQVSTATVTEKGCWIYAVKAATGTVKVAWTAVQV